MNVFIANLNEDRARIGKQISRHGQTVTQVGQVGVNAVAPRITKGPHLLRLTSDVINLVSNLFCGC